VFIASIALSAVIGIGVLIFGNFGHIEARVLMTTLSVTIMSILGLACGAYYETGRGRALPVAGIILSLTAGLMSFFIIWNVLDRNELFIKAFLTATMLAAACAHLSLLSLARLDRRFAWSRATAFVCVSLLCAISLYILWLEPIGGSDLIYRLLGVLGILVAAVTILTPVLHKLSSTEPDVEALDKEIERLKKRLAELELERSELQRS
jgi:signal transduction histidine kinase